MALKTGRADGTADVRIDRDRCNACGLCLTVCKGMPLYRDGDGIGIDQSRIFGCIGCGQCMAVCPRECIYVTGRSLAPGDMVPMPPKERRAGYDQLRNLMISRRSVRDFRDDAVDRGLTEKIIAAASTSPMGLPPSDVEVLVLEGRDSVREFAGCAVDFMRKIKWLFSPAMLLLMRPFMSREDYDSSRTFLRPVIDFITDRRNSGEDWLLYGAPLAMYFHSSPYSDPVDPVIPATYAMLAAESLGLGSCMIGTIAFIVKYSSRMRKKYGIPGKNRQGVMVIFGHPRVKYKRAIKRTFARVDFR
ncbi:MAG: nitroreductase family protein [Spirochaetes bacterium]|nr:nitroreductase family protein [Spirochaetota bacterium]